MCTAFHDFVNMKHCSSAFKVLLRKIGDENFVPGLSLKWSVRLNENLSQETIFLAITLQSVMVIGNG